jgi:DNA-binding transcriptional MerR regulator
MLIAEVSKKYDIPADTLRYYERVGLIPSVHRTSSGIRDYDEQDCGWVDFIKCMRSAGLTIEVLIEYVSLFQQGDKTITVRKNLLQEQRKQLKERMADMQKTLERLDYKIANYEKVIVPASKRLMGKK